MNATTGASPSARPRWLWPAAWLVGLAVLAAVLWWNGAASNASAGNSAIVRLGLPLASALAAACGAVTIGALAVAICILPRDKPGHQHPGRHLPPANPRWLATLRIAANGAGLWTLALAIQLVLTYAKTSGEGLASEGFADGLIYYATTVTSGRALALTLLLVLATFIATIFMRSYIAVAWTEALAIVALIPQAATGHAAGSGGHMVAMGAAFLHAVTVSMWLGGLFAIAVLWRRLASVPQEAATAIGRLTHLDRWCLVLVAVSGIAASWVRLNGPDELLTTTYGQLILIKAATLVLIAVLGWLIAREMAENGRLDDEGLAGAGRKPVGAGDEAQVEATGRRARSIAGRLLALEVTLAAGALAVAAGLAAGRAPVPDSLATTTIEQLTGYGLPPAPSWLNFIALWHPDVLLGTACVAGTVVYVRWVIRLRRRGDAWPWGRTLSWMSGMVAMFWVCDGGPAVYGHLLFSAHMILHMVVAMVIPIMLCLAAPVTLLVRAIEPRTDGSRGPREWMLALVHSRPARFFSHPIPASINFVGSMIIFYFTPLFALAMSTHLGHIAMVLHFTLAGYLFSNLLIGIDPGPNRPAYPVRLLLLFCTMAFHAFFGIAIISSQTVLAASWFDQLGTLWGIDRLADQATGGAITWGIGEIPTLCLAIALIVLWSSADDRAAKRHDRAADRSGDADLEEYNAMLARLAERDRQDAS